MTFKDEVARFVAEVMPSRVVMAAAAEPHSVEIVDVQELKRVDQSGLAAVVGRGEMHRRTQVDIGVTVVSAVEHRYGYYAKWACVEQRRRGSALKSPPFPSGTKPRESFAFVAN